MANSLAEQKEEWEALLQMPAWQKLETMIAEQVAGRINRIVLTPLPATDAVYEQEFTKGEIAALKLIAQTPALEIEQLTADIKRVNSEENQNET